MRGSWHITLSFLMLILATGFAISASQPSSSAHKAGSATSAEEQKSTPSLAFSTYLGGSGDDMIRGIATDSHGNTYLTGYTASSEFPTTPGAYDRRFHGWYDIFVAKLDPKGQLVWSTLLGGRGFDLALAIEVDKQGYVYIAGAAGPGAPVTPGAFQTNYNGYYTGQVYGGQNAYLAKLKPDGSGLVWASYFGATELIRDLAIDQRGDVYVLTNSQSVETGTWPAVWFNHAFQRTRNDPSDAVVAKIRSDGSQVVWATYLGGSSTEGKGSIRVDATGHAYVVVPTRSPDFPTTAGAYDRSYHGGGDFGVAKLTPDGSNLVFSTYLGGAGAEEHETHSLALDARGNVYIAAYTTSRDFPTTPGAFRRTYGGGTYDAFISKISADGSQLLASTYIGGNDGEGTEGISVDAQGNVYISGTTSSTDFPVTADAFQRKNRGKQDFFLLKLAADFSHPLYATYLGGSGADEGRTSCLDANGNVYVAGQTQSDDFPTRNAFQPSRTGAWDGSLAKFVFRIGGR